MKQSEERIIKPLNGFVGLTVNIIVLLLSVLLFVINVILFDGLLINGLTFGILLALSIIVFVASCMCFGGLRVINPNEALVLSLFGKYYGTVYDSGFYFVNPFATAIYPKKAEEDATKDAVQVNAKQIYLKMTPRKISTKIQTFANG